MLYIDRQSRRLLAFGRQRPPRRDFELFGVKRYDLTLVFDVYKNGSFFIASRKLGPPAQIDRTGYFAVRCVDRGRVFASSVKGKNALTRRIVNDRIGICAGLYRIERLQGFCIEYNDRIVATVAY